MQKVQLNTAMAGQQFSLFGLSPNQTKGLIGSMTVQMFETVYWHRSQHFQKRAANSEVKICLNFA